MEYNNCVSVEKDTGMKKNSKRFEKHENNLAFQIDYTSNFNKSFRREFQAKYISNNITHDEFTILYALSYVPDISQSELANLLFKGKAHIGKILNDMEEKGLIKRSAETRGNIIVKRNTITPEGSKIFKSGNKEFDRVKDIIDQNFTKDELKLFISFLKRYRDILEMLVDVKLK